MYDIMRCVTLFVSDAVDYEFFVIEQFHVVLNIFYIIAFTSTSSASPLKGPKWLEGGVNSLIKFLAKH